MQKKKKDLCSVWRRCRDWSNASKVVWEVSWYYAHFGQTILCCGAVWCIARCLAAPLASAHLKPTMGESRHTQNIQINKVISENEKCVFHFMGKKCNRLFGQRNTFPYPQLFLTLSQMSPVPWEFIFSNTMTDKAIGKTLKLEWEKSSFWKLLFRNMGKCLPRAGNVSTMR